jgi:hypothetical protein
MGVVYKARQEGLNRLVALKMILDSASVGSQGVMRFQSEAEAVAQLQHPHIVQIYDVGEYEDRTYLALEFVDGGNLADKLKGIPLPARQAADIMAAVARAVHFAHQRLVRWFASQARLFLTGEGGSMGSCENCVGTLPPFAELLVETMSPAFLRPRTRSQILPGNRGWQAKNNKKYFALGHKNSVESRRE